MEKVTCDEEKKIYSLNDCTSSDSNKNKKNKVECKIMQEQEYCTYLDKANIPFLEQIVPIQYKQHTITCWESLLFLKKNESTGHYDNNDNYETTPASYDIIQPDEYISIDLIERSPLSLQCKERIYRCFTQPIETIDADITWICFNFAIYIATGEIIEHNAKIRDTIYANYQQIVFNKKDLEPGDIIFRIEDKKNIKLEELAHHSMFFLGENYILHKKGGERHSIMISTLDSLCGFHKLQYYDKTLYKVYIIKTSKIKEKILLHNDKL